MKTTKNVPATLTELRGELAALTSNVRQAVGMVRAALGLDVIIAPTGSAGNMVDEVTTLADAVNDLRGLTGLEAVTIGERPTTLPELMLVAGVLTSQAVDALNLIETFSHAAGALAVRTALLIIKGDDLHHPDVLAVEVIPEQTCTPTTDAEPVESADTVGNSGSAQPLDSTPEPMHLPTENVEFEAVETSTPSTEDGTNKRGRNARGRNKRT